MDTKTTGRWDATFERKWHTAAQITCYCYVAQEHLKRAGIDEPIAGAIINAIEVKKIPGSKSKCQAKPPHEIVVACAWVPIPGRSSMAEPKVTSSASKLTAWRSTA